MPRLLCGTAVWTTMTLLTASLWAAPPAAAITDLGEVDDDFAVQGEYTGSVNFGQGRARKVGLQVVALGNGEFRGMQYIGGLPGAGWNGRDRFEMFGHRHAGVLVLMKFPYSAVIHHGVADLGDTSQGLEMGRIRRVERTSPTVGTPAPANATVLFANGRANGLKGAQVDENGWLKEGCETEAAYGDFTLHLEFRLPYMPAARGQGRANSGAYLQGRYEVQILDSFGLEGVENECGALYKQRRPDVNMCLPPLTWQAYDIEFRAARFDAAGEKTENARITVRHNGVAIHDDVEIPTKTGAGAKESPEPRPIKFQDHSNPVRFRNIWIVEGATQRSPGDYRQDPARAYPYTALTIR